MSAFNKRESVHIASVISGCSLALLHTVVMAAEPTLAVAGQPAGSAAPVSEAVPVLGSAHRHGDGHRCVTAHGPVAMATVVSRPLQMVQQLQSENQKTSRLRSAP